MNQRETLTEDKVTDYIHSKTRRNNGLWAKEFMLSK